MPKALRFFSSGCHYHLTHRCHGQQFLLKHACDRSRYRELLRLKSRIHRVPVMGYCVTKNHVHLLVTAPDGKSVSSFMDALEGDFAQRYNLRKSRSDAFWGGRFRAAAIEESTHLWNCLVYILLNMVRVGAVTHPREWPWCSYGELSGARRRYLVVDRDHFASVFHHGSDLSAFRANIDALIDRKLVTGVPGREPCWTESLAVGSREYVTAMEKNIQNRCRLEIKAADNDALGAWMLRERAPDYA